MKEEVGLTCWVCYVHEHVCICVMMWGDPQGGWGPPEQSWNGRKYHREPLEMHLGRQTWSQKAWLQAPPLLLSDSIREKKIKM